MDADLKSAIGEVTTAAKEASAAAREATEAAKDATSAAKVATEGLNEVRNIAINNHADISKRLGALNRNFGVLWRRVHGSEPPAPDPNLAPVELSVSDAPPPLDEMVEQAHEKASSTSLELAALEGRMIAGFSAMGSELRKQSSAMGLGVRGFQWVGTRDGARTVLAVITLFGAIYAAVRPHAVPTAPSPQVVYVTPAPRP